MGTNEAARARAGLYCDTVDRWRIRAEANAPHVWSERSVTALILAICGWSLIEAPFERGTSADDSGLMALVLAKLAIFALGALAIADVRYGRGIFAFVCCTSVLAIAPGLPQEFTNSVAIALLSLIECIGKAAFVIAVCTRAMREEPS